MNPADGSLGPIKQNLISQQYQINIQSSLNQRPAGSVDLKLPRADLLNGTRKDYNEICLPLYQASISGNWKPAKVIIENRRELVRFSITKKFETVLHIAVLGKSYSFVEYLVSLMERDDLELQDINGQTAFYLAALHGCVNSANLLVRKNNALVDIPSREGMLPLYMAVLFRKQDMVKYLYHKSQEMTGGLWTPQNRGWVFLKCVEADLFDIAIEMVKKHQELALDWRVLNILARKHGAFIKEGPNIFLRLITSIPPLHLMIGTSFKEKESFRLLGIILKKLRELPMPEFRDIIRAPADDTIDDNATTSAYVGNPNSAHQKYSSQVLFVAAEMGNTEFVVEIIQQYPDLLQDVNDHNQSIFHVAVAHRQLDIYNLLYEIGSIKDLIITLEDENGNNMLHLIGEDTKNNQLQHVYVPGVGLQLQREVLWFKEIENILPPPFREKKNTAGLTPHEVFTKNHKELLSNTEKSMKETSAQLMVVATLIATIAFAAAFSFPGGYNQDTGIPIYLQKALFKVFIILDGVSFISSSASILMVLSMLTSRYAEDDFVSILPLKMIKSLAALFISVTAMIFAFLINFFLLCQKEEKWMPYLIVFFATMPYIVFNTQRHPLLFFMFLSTYASSHFFGNKNKLGYKKVFFF